MPLYTYQCEKCKTEFDIIHGYSDPKPHCPECDSEETTKVYKPSTLNLTGIGLYKPGVSNKG